MAKPDERQIDWLAQTMAARMLVDAASDARQPQLDQALRFWLPTDELDQLELIQVRQAVQEKLRGLSAAVDVRLKTRIEAGRARPLDGCDGRL